MSRRLWWTVGRAQRRLSHELNSAVMMFVFYLCEGDENLVIDDVLCCVACKCVFASIDPLALVHLHSIAFKNRIRCGEHQLADSGDLSRAHTIVVC